MCTLKRCSRTIAPQQHPARTEFCLYTMVVYEKKYLEAYTNDQYILLKNNTTQLYSKLGRIKLLWNFFMTPEDGFDIYRFTGSGSLLCALLEICEKQGHPQL